jgi:Ca-activated chloride channel homolog
MPSLVIGNLSLFYTSDMGLRTSTALTVLLAGFVSMAGVFGQDPPVLRVDVSLVTLDVEVTDSVGRTVNNLTRGDFEVFENGMLQDLRSFDSVESPYNIMLLFDCSASTEPAWPFLVEAMNRFLQTLRKQDRMAIAQFGGGFKLLRKSFSSAEEAVDVGVQPRDTVCAGTNFYGAIDRALEELKAVKTRKGAVILTDGEHDDIPRQKGKELQARPRYVDSVEDKDFQKVLRAVAGSGVALYFVAVNTDLNPNEFNTEEIYNKQQLRSRMELLASRSGGRVAYPKKPDEVVKLYEQLAHDLGTSYSLGYVPANMAKDGTFRKIEVRVGDRSMRVRQSRDGYTAQ